ncbi:universal stress protein [Streptomyces sp. GC420]|uniref:universal stress protein n=1 Tax=Streptomyces sp. GC420 TaxID=2697568 RepID=UPI001414E1F2|nr:universal stress protein [Streptomyces sp. GC420]NBM19147.1 universal stress protein [Streptomyces sp. GC420]
MSSPIVVGLDGSPESLAAAEWAAREAGLRSLPLVLLNARVEQPGDIPVNLDLDAQKRRAQEILQKVSEDLTSRHPDLPVSVELIPDTATKGLLERAEDAELLVLGSRGHGAVAGFLLGSVGMQIVARAKSPVVLVRPGERADADPEDAEVVVAVEDRTAPAPELMRFAFAAAAARGVGLRVVHAWKPLPIYAYNPEALRLEDEGRENEAQVRKEFADGLAPWREQYPDVELVETLDLASASDVVLQHTGHAALVVVGRRTHRPALGMRIGPVTHGVIHHSAAPVAVVPHD